MASKTKSNKRPVALSKAELRLSREIDPFYIQQFTQRRAAKQSLHQFVESARTGDAERMLDAMCKFDWVDPVYGGWKQAMRAIARVGSVPERTQEVFLRFYVRYGDHIRQECEDIALVEGLRVLLPKYEGGAVRMYRGQAAPERGKRSYGLSWSKLREVAENHAKGIWRTCSGGSVVLSTLAPPEAIICCVADHTEERFHEEEYIVDWRRLHRVTKLTRYAQKPLTPKP